MILAHAVPDLEAERTRFAAERAKLEKDAADALKAAEAILQTRPAVIVPQSAPSGALPQPRPSNGASLPDTAASSALPDTTASGVLPDTAASGSLPNPAPLQDQELRDPKSRNFRLQELTIENVKPQQLNMDGLKLQDFIPPDTSPFLLQPAPR